METLHLNHTQYMESIADIGDDTTYRFALQAEKWWNRHFSWNKDGCRVLIDDKGHHLVYLFYKVDRYRDYLTVHNLFTPLLHRNRGHAFAMLEDAFSHQAERNVKRFRMSCTPGALGFYDKLALIYWGVDTTGNYLCDLPLPQEGVAGIENMIETQSNHTLLGKEAQSIYKKVQIDGEDFETEKQERFTADKILLGDSYRHDSLKEIIAS